MRKSPFVPFHFVRNSLGGVVALIALVSCATLEDAQREALMDAKGIPEESRHYKYLFLADEQGGEVYSDPEFYDTMPQMPVLELEAQDIQPEPVSDLPQSDLPIVLNEAVQKWIDWFSGDPNGRKFFQRALARKGRYQKMIVEKLREADMPTDLLYQAMIESGFNAHAYSRSHASGVWQFIRGTGRRYGLTSDWCIDERCDPVEATDAAIKYMRRLYDEFDDWWLAAAAYNAGEGRVRQAVRRHKSKDYWELAKHRRPLRLETRNYVPKMIAALMIAKQPKKYRFDHVQPDPPYEFETVEIEDAIDLSVLAKAANIKTSELKLLNPHLRSWYTPPNQTFSMRVPVGAAQSFQANLDAIPVEKRVTFRKHRIRSGDTLGHIAVRYNTKVGEIKRLNGLRNSRIRAGKTLMIPVPEGVKVAKATQPAPLPKATPSDVALRSEVSVAVRSGDTLWDIAQEAGVSIREIKRWNGLRSSRIRPGQRLTLYLKRNSQPDSLNVVADAPPAQRDPLQPAPITPTIDYIVRKGDTLWDIAQANRTTVDRIRIENRLGARSSLRPGQKLQIRPHSNSSSPTGAAKRLSYRVRRGDTLWDIARAYGTTIQRIRKDNRLGKRHVLRPGDTLTLNLP